MGENKHINELDAFAKKHIKSIENEKPSMDFTASVMQTILKTQSLTRHAYEPLISKKVWFLIVAGVISLFFIPLERSTEKRPLFDKVDFTWFEEVSFGNFLSNIDISLSNSAGYALILCAVMVLIQVIILKNYFSGKYN